LRPLEIDDRPLFVLGPAELTLVLDEHAVADTVTHPVVGSPLLFVVQIEAVFASPAEDRKRFDLVLFQGWSYIAYERKAVGPWPV
jgi:hypothetical protein